MANPASPKKKPKAAQRKKDLVANPGSKPRGPGTLTLLDYILQFHAIFMDQQADPNPIRKFVTVEQLATDHELDRATVNRYLRFMRDRMRLPVCKIASRGGQGYTEPVHSFPLHTLTQGDMMMFVLAKRAFGEGTPFAGRFKPFYEKVTAGLLKAEVDLERLESVVHFHFSGLDAPVPVGVELWDSLAHAAMHCHELRCRHLKAEHGARPTSRVLWPLSLSEIGHAWYLWAIESGSADPFPKKFSMARLSNIDLTGRTFQKIKFDPRAELGNSLGAFGGKAINVRLHITGKQALLVPERLVHDSQKLARRPDGSLDLSLKVAHNPDLEGWILMRAGDVEVISPTPLRDAIHRLHTAGTAKNAPQA